MIVSDYVVGGVICGLVVGDSLFLAISKLDLCSLVRWQSKTEFRAGRPFASHKFGAAVRLHARDGNWKRQST